MLRNIQVYCAMSQVKIDPCEKKFESIAQCLNVLCNVRVYYAMSRVKVDLYEVNPNATMLDKDKFWTMCSEQNVLNNFQPVLKMKMKKKMKMKNLYKT